MTLAHPDMIQCIDACGRCSRTCLETLMYCMEHEAHRQPEHLRLMLECADLCAVSARFMIASSDFHRKLCGLCAEVCMACAESCGQFGDDATMQECAAECRKCAEVCQVMALGTQPANA